MSDRGRAAAARAMKRNDAKRARQEGDKVVRDAIHAMNVEAAEATERDTAEGDPDEFEDEADE